MLQRGMKQLVQNTLIKYKCVFKSWIALSVLAVQNNGTVPCNRASCSKHYGYSLFLSLMICLVFSGAAMGLRQGEAWHCHLWLRCTWIRDERGMPFSFWHQCRLSCSCRCCYSSSQVSVISWATLKSNIHNFHFICSVFIPKDSFGESCWALELLVIEMSVYSPIQWNLMNLMMLKMPKINIWKRQQKILVPGIKTQFLMIILWTMLCRSYFLSGKTQPVQVEKHRPTHNMDKVDLYCSLVREI